VLGVGLLLLLLPIFLLAAAAVHLSSHGPAIFRQERVGRNGERFMIYKLRTMTIDSPTFGPKPVCFDDDRITPVGRFLRRTSIDEIPQLFNVLRGDMSLVGPRPEQAFLVERYEDWQLERLSVHPGMTGWWQVNGRKQPMHDYVEEDLYYVQNQSLWLDLCILVKTVKVVVNGQGAA
jgi:lipopolysaccharide/colanic/teichoic acid biosynthesis glycosyltransferase